MPQFVTGGGGLFAQIGPPLIPPGADARGGWKELRPLWESIDEAVGLKAYGFARDYLLKFALLVNPLVSFAIDNLSTAKPLGAGEEARIREELTRAAFGLHGSPEAVAAFMARLVFWMNAGGVTSGMQLPMWTSDP